MYFGDGRYRYVPKEGAPIELGTVLGPALEQYGRLVNPERRNLVHMGEIGDTYMIEIAPRKSPRTREDNVKEWANLRPSFAHLLPSEITPQMMYKYMAARAARVRANREKALLSHMLTYAVYKGIISNNPIAWQMRRDMINHGERPRTRLPDERDIDTLKSVSSEMIRCYVDFKEFSGWRKGDILTLNETTDLREDGIYVMPRKGRRLDPDTGERTGRERMLKWSDDLRALVERIKALKRALPRARPGAVTTLPARRRSPYLFAPRDGGCYYNIEKSRSDGFDAIWKRYMTKAKAKAQEQGWTLEHFTEHDVRAKAGTDAERDGRQGHKLLGNSLATFKKTYDRGVEIVEPNRRTTR